MTNARHRLVLACLAVAIAPGALLHCAFAADLTPGQWASVQAAEEARVNTIARVSGAVVCVFANDRMGGGSAVLYQEDGLALTNFHVAVGAGEQGIAGLPDGKLYRWKTIGLDPGGDLAVIQLAGRPGQKFPLASLGDSDAVGVGDWAMAMGNPFVLAEDYKPTVTLGVVSGVGRFQPGEGGGNLLVYGNCIQVSSSINPGNSGGPLFDMAGRVVGINGRGSFEERGRVNVGVGYAVSGRQIWNFLPDLEASKVCRHGTLDATFRDVDGKVICQAVNLDGVIGKLGLDLTDTLLSFDGHPISSANQYLNLVSMLPAHWPVEVVWDHRGTRRSDWVRLAPLTYPLAHPAIQPGTRPARSAAAPGELRDMDLNRQACQRILRRWTRFRGGTDLLDSVRGFRIVEDVYRGSRKLGSRTTLWTADGAEKVEASDAGVEAAIAGAQAGTPSLPVGLLQRMLGRDLSISEFPGIVLQGGDKAAGERAYRIVFAYQGRKVVAWLSLLGSDSAFEARLLKIAPADLTGSASDVATTFSDYRRIGGFMFPFRRRIVQGLGEQVLLEIVGRSVEVLGAPASAPSVHEDATATTRPDAGAGNIFGPAIAYAQKRCVKIYGQGVGLEHGYATGIIVGADGLILTAQALLTDGGDIQVVMPDGMTYRGPEEVKVVRRSTALQAVLLKVDVATPDYFELPGHAIVEQGDWVVAVGNWFNVASGAEHLSAAVGVVSLRAAMEAKRQMQDVPLEGQVLLIDAITGNPGAPGGALLTADGRLAGMIGKVVESRSTNTRINYAVPSDLLRPLVLGRDEVAEHGPTRAQGGYVGLRLFALAGLGAPAYIDFVAPGSPADLAGLHKDDLILRVGGEYVDDCKTYNQQAAKFEPGVPVALLIKRQDKVLAVALTPTAPRPRGNREAIPPGGIDGQ